MISYNVYSHQPSSFPQINHSTVVILVAEADQEDRLVFLHVPLMLAQVHLFKPMVELVANLVIHHFPNVVEAVVEEV